MVLAPAQDRVRGELGTVIGHDHPRLAALVDERRELAGNPLTGDRDVRDCRQTFPGHVIGDVKDAKAPAAAELVMDEIKRPSGIWLGFNENGRAGSYCLAATSAFAHSQSLLTIEPIDAVDPGWLAFGP